MIGAVGRDDAGASLRAALAANGVAVGAVRMDEQVGTGIALITVDASGENTIVVSPAPMLG